VVDKAFDSSRASEDPKVVADAYKVIAGEISKDAPLRSYRYKSGFLFTSEKVHGLVPAGYYQGLAAYIERAWIEK
jgi:peptide/nickel transport system substrate-binding protein